METRDKYLDHLTPGSNIPSCVMLETCVLRTRTNFVTHMQKEKRQQNPSSIRPELHLQASSDMVSQIYTLVKVMRRRDQLVHTYRSTSLPTITLRRAAVLACSKWSTIAMIRRQVRCVRRRHYRIIVRKVSGSSARCRTGILPVEAPELLNLRTRGSFLPPHWTVCYQQKEIPNGKRHLGPLICTLLGNTGRALAAKLGYPSA